ncbi:hypothetical protein PPL_07507 [Heterostelium album PN500]|uniref:Uncharacterized protein n=1 Tax=Heterostelium pallidum (strain ATCC 26659 / Pp 5 / PN500) TaxID=670386 RepID=D3BG56_HETP5|nr:hypothetical protein PPL_07507 [Heterostelium album PN500]EFA79648.1 hypothetical protein PPL_07507 [Heterostelium album PN500]|eukprot:XP_020431769.1 hypothetical protein PPL_07507 [Heterostelium album PN500]
MSANCIGNKSIRQLANSLKCNSTLSSLDLGFNRITDKGGILLLESLSSTTTTTTTTTTTSSTTSKVCPIEKLILSGNQLTYQFGEVLSLFLCLETTKLKYLDISHCSIKKCSAQLIQSILTNQTLTNVNINHTNLKKSSLKHLIYNIENHRSIIELKVLNQHYIIPQSIIKYLNNIESINII